MRALTAQLDEVLRGPAAGGVARLVGWSLVCGGLYGAVMGAFGGVAGDRAWQVLISAAKVPLLLLASFAISLPSFFVLNTLLGLRADFCAVVRALVGSQAGLTVVLASLAPYTALWYASFADYHRAILFNGVMFLVATAAAQRLLWRGYRPLIARNGRHRWILVVWLLAYWFVAIQMAWVLRPFVGEPGRPVTFFREDTWGNAYVIVAQSVRDALRR